MQLSDISSQKLAPGRYLITASYDGDVQYNPAEAQLVLVIDANGEASYETRPIDDDGEMQVVKVSPNVQFTPSTISIVEKNLDKYPFNWKQYFSNPYNVGYSSYVSTGLTMYADETIGWEASGTYVLTIITNETELYTSQTITLTMNVTSKVNPRVEYVNDNGQFTLENGNFTKRYRNIEKREGVYMFDLLQPTNPYSLPLKYKIDDDKHGTIDVDGNKIYISAEGKYKITAYYEGDDTYRSSITYYILKYYEGEEPSEDEPNPQKISPNLSFVSSNVTQDKNDDNRYKVLQLINPYNVSGGTWVVSKGNITSDGKTITYDGVGSISVSYIYNGNDKYLPQIVTYILNINSEDNPDNLPVPDIGFTELIVTVDENEAHEYQIQYAYNNSGVAIDYYYNGNLIENGILKTTSTGNLTIMGQSKNNGTFAATKIYYTLQIVKYQAKDPEISFDTNSVKEYQTSNFEYLLQFVSNPHNVELVWSSSKGVINDNILYCEELGTVIITVKSKPTFYYLESTISYTLEIEESPKLSPELSFDEEAQFFNANSTLQYPVQAVNNPHNVELRWFSDRGELNSEMSPTILTISYYSGPVNIYCKSVEDETYKSEVVTYKLFVGAAKKYLQYTKHEDYNIERNQGTFDLEMLRYAKSQDLEFDPSEWTFTSSLTYCTIEEKYYVEDGDDIVVMAKLRFTKQCNPLISISFAGNGYFYNTSGIRVHVNLLGKKLLSPEISFSDSYQLVDINADYRYLLQDVENPHNVEIVYSSSAGTVEGNYLIYQDKYNVIVKATSVENDTYESQTISYKLEFKEAQKPSSGIHFAQPLVEITQTNDGIYELQGLVDAEDNPIADTSTLGYYSANIFGDITYDENRGCYIIENEHFTGNATIRFIIYETQEYRKETISYVLKINSNKKASPELAFAKYQINVTQKSDGIYQIQELINPHNVPVTWFCSKGEFDDPNNPQTISFSGRDYISIGVQSQETETYAAQRQSYGMTIMLPSKRDPGLTFDDYQMTTIRNDEGIYPLQRANNPNNVSPLTYSVNKGTIEGDNIIYDGIGMLTITVSYAGDDVYNAVNLRYTLDIGGKFKKYLEVENCQSVEMTGELNEDIEVQLVRWNANKEYTYNPSEWTITSSHFRCTYKTAKAQEINGYVYLIGTFSFKSEGTAYITISFKGNDDFQNDEQHGLWIEYTVPTVVDNRVLPSISFNNYMLYVTQTTNYMYLLQSLNKPDDVEIDHWELDYGGSDFATAKIIDDEYVYYEGTDYVHVKVYTKESEVYKQATDGYDLYVNKKTKTGTSIIFTWDKINVKRAVDGIYNIQSPSISPSNLPVVWSTSKGELINNNTQLRYSDVGEVTITASFAGDDDYEAATASYNLVISNQYVQRDLNATKLGDQHLIVDYATEYDIPLIKWPLSENLEYDETEWLFTGDNDSKWNLVCLFTSDDAEYRTLYAKMTFSQNGNTYYTLKLQNNAFFYNNTWQAEIYFEKPAQEKINPKISWPNPDPGNVTYREDNKYLIQTPISEYNDVTFNTPYSGKTVIKEGDNYYIQYSSTGPIDVFVSNVGTDKYYSVTISYRFTIVASQEKPTHVLLFDQSTFNRNKSKDNEYNLLTPTTNGNASELQWKADKDDCIIDAVNKKVYWSGTGAVKITAYYPETENYGYVEASYTMIVSETVQKTYLQASEYKNQTIEVDFGEEYDIPIIKWSLTENLDFDEDEWYLSNSYATKCVVDHLFTVDEDGYRILKAKCSFTTSGTTYLRIRFLGNDYFYDSIYNGFTLEFNRAPDIEVRDPQISWPEPTPDPVPYSDEHLYLIQTPTSPFQEVGFNAPTTSGLIVEDDGAYYLQTENWGEYTISVSSKATGVLYDGSTRYMYAAKTISYKLTISRPVIEKTDARLAFANAEEELPYIWQETVRKLYKVQPLYNPYGVPVSFRATPVGGLQKLDSTVYMRDENQAFTGYIDYGYYIEYEDLADITITVTMQENDYHYSNYDPSYVMHIVRGGTEVTMWFSAETVEKGTNNAQLYEIQEVMLRPDIPQIRDNVKYTLLSQTGILVQQGSKLYLSYRGTGSVRIKATFNGDTTYAPVEAIYTLRIVENTKQPAPIDFPDSDIYTPKNQYNAYPVQQPQSTDGKTYDLTGHLTWTYPEGWYRNTNYAGHMISPNFEITDDTDVLIKCYLEETQFQEKYMQYTLHILTEHKVYLGAEVHNDYNLEVEENTNLKLELLKWPASQDYTFDSSEWTFTRWMINPLNNNRYDTDITSYITCEAVDGYYVLYYNCNTGDSGSHIGFDIHYGIDIVFNGNSGYQGGEWGLYIDLTEKETPPPPIEKKNPNIRYMRDIYDIQLYGDDTHTANIPQPYISYDYPYEQTQYPIELTYKYWVAQALVDNPQDYTDFVKIDDPVETSHPIMDPIDEGYYYIECTTIENELFNSVTVPTIVKIERYYDKTDPDVTFDTNYMHPIRSSWYYVPEVINNSGVEYHWYIRYKVNGGTNMVEHSLTVTNGQFQYSELEDEFIVILRTVETSHYNSIDVVCRYVIGYTSESIFSDTNNINNIIRITGKPISEKIYDEINFIECNYDFDPIGSQINNYASLVNWNDDSYEFDPEDWTYEITPKIVQWEIDDKGNNTITTQSISQFKEIWDIPKLMTSELQSKDKNIIPHFIFYRSTKLDKATFGDGYKSGFWNIEPQNIEYDNGYIVGGRYNSWYRTQPANIVTIKFEFKLSFKGKKDQHNSYINCLVPWESKTTTIYFTYYYYTETSTSGSMFGYKNFKKLENINDVLTPIGWLESKIPIYIKVIPTDNIDGAGTATIIPG